MLERVCDVVVIGSYPPLPGLATAATLAAVRRAWDPGADVCVVSYRTGAGEITVPVTGSLAGRRLDQVRHHFANPPEVVLGLQPRGAISDQRPAQQLATAFGLAAAMRRFRRATLLVGEDPKVTPACFHILASPAERFVVATPEDASWLVKRYRLKPAAVAVEEVEPLPPGPPMASTPPLPGSTSQARRRPHRCTATHHDPGRQARAERGGRGGALHLGPKSRQTGQAPLAGPAVRPQGAPGTAGEHWKGMKFVGPRNCVEVVCCRSS